VQRTPSLGFAITVEGEMGVAGFLVNLFKKCGVDLWLVWLCSKRHVVCQGVSGLKGWGG